MCYVYRLFRIVFEILKVWLKEEKGVSEYGSDEENTEEVDMSMVLLFSARVCLSHLNRVDDCRQ